MPLCVQAFMVLLTHASCIMRAIGCTLEGDCVYSLCARWDSTHTAIEASCSSRSSTTCTEPHWQHDTVCCVCLWFAGWAVLQLLLTRMPT